MAAIGRNAPCPCGSGNKYKRCCALKPQHGSPVKAWILMSVIGLMLLAGAVIGLSSLDDERTGRGLVWSEEHGHWH